LFCTGCYRKCKSAILLNYGWQTTLSIVSHLLTITATLITKSLTPANNIVDSFSSVDNNCHTHHNKPYTSQFENMTSTSEV
jgi:hypothetical protein